MNERLEKREIRESRESRETRTFEAPRVDVYESDAELLVVADLPGVAADAVDVRFEEGGLVVEGRRARDRGRDFRRVFALPEGVDVDRVSAKQANGVLEVRLPKAPQRRTRKIEVRAG